MLLVLLTVRKLQNNTRLLALHWNMLNLGDTCANFPPTSFSLPVLSQVLDKHKAMDSMVELLQVYPEEDEAYVELLEATTQLYHYLLQPFRDMRELAMLRRQQIKVTHTQTHTQIQIPSVLRLDLSRFSTSL